MPQSDCDSNHSNEPQKEKVLVLNIELEQGRFCKIPVKRTENAVLIASKFCIEHQLTFEICQLLAQ